MSACPVICVLVMNWIEYNWYDCTISSTFFHHKRVFPNSVIAESYFPDHIYLVTGFEVEAKKNHLNNPYVTV